MTIVYEADNGWTIVVQCPWVDHSGHIPPPTIAFGNLVFRYAGSATPRTRAAGDDDR